MATDKDNPFEVLFEDIVTVEDKTIQLKTDQEQAEEMLKEDNSDGQHERTFVLCSEYEEDELSLGIDTPEVQEEDILLFGDNLLKPLKRKKKREDKNKMDVNNTRAKRFRSAFVKCDGTWRTRPCKGNAKKSYIFEEVGSNFSLTWWPTNGTVFVQSKKETSDIIDGILNSVIAKMEEKKKPSDIFREQGKEPPEFEKNSDVKAKKKIRTL